MNLIINNYSQVESYSFRRLVVMTVFLPCYDLELQKDKITKLENITIWEAKKKEQTHNHLTNVAKWSIIRVIRFSSSFIVRFYYFILNKVRQLLTSS